MKQKLSVLGVAAIVVILYSVIVFLVPFQRDGVFWLSYIFTLIALVSQLLFVQMAFGGGTSARSRFYGYPIFRVGMIYLIVQMIVSLIFMILASVFLGLPLWIPAILYLLILGAGAIGLIATDNVRDTVQLVEEKHADNTALMRNLRRNAEVMASRYPELAQAAEALKYADPVSTTVSESYERQLNDLLSQAPQCPNGQALQQLNDQMLELLKQRNAVCKSGKTR